MLLFYDHFNRREEVGDDLKKESQNFGLKL
jgi:hypothetical protein